MPKNVHPGGRNPGAQAISLRNEPAPISPPREKNQGGASRRTPATLPEPVTVDQWWKNRGGETIRLLLSTFEGRNIVILRTWWTDKDGVLKRGMGFACSIKHLPKLAKVFARAMTKAHELGLIDDGGEE